MLVVSDDGIIDFPQEDGHELRASLREIIASAVTHTVIEAPTGSGKSHAAASEVINRVGSDRAVTYVAANKVQLAEFVSLLCQLYKFDGKSSVQREEFLLSKGIVVKYHKGKRSDDSEGISTGDVGPDVKFVLTHHDYLLPEGDGIQFARFLTRWDKDDLQPMIIIDEGDQFISQLYKTHSLDQRYVEKHRPGEDKPLHFRTLTCPMRTGHEHSSCNHCQLIENSLEWRSNTFGQCELYNPATIQRIDVDRQLTNLNQYQHNETEIRFGQFRLSLLKGVEDHFGNFLIRDPDLEGKPHDAEGYIEERFRRAGCVVLITTHPTIDGVQVDPSVIPVDRDDRRQMDIQYPAQQCQARQLAIQDMSPLNVLQRVASPAVLMSASFDSHSKRVIERGFLQNVQFKKVEPKAERKVKELVVVMTPQDFSGPKHSDVVGELSQVSRTLLFEATKKEAMSWADQLEVLPGATVWDGGSLVHHVGGNIASDDTTSCGHFYKLIIAYANSAISRGINAPQYRTAIVNVGIHLPTLATKFDPENFTEAAIKRAHIDVQTEKTKQCLGRILRHDKIHEDDGRRVGMLHNIPVVDGEVVVPQETMNMLSEMAETVTFVWFKKGSDAVKAIIGYWAGEDIGGSAIPPDMRTQAFIKQRERSLKEAEKMAKRLRDWSTWILTGMDWREFSRKSNINRYRERWGNVEFQAVVELLKQDHKVGKLSKETREKVMELEEIALDSDV